MSQYIHQCKGFASEVAALPDLKANAKIVSLLTFQLLLYMNFVQILQLMLPHIFFYSLCKEIQQQMEEQTTVFVQITYKSQQEVPRHMSVVPKHMADICTSECLAGNFWRSARLKFIPILNQKVRALFFPPVYFIGMHDACVCIFCIFFLAFY